MFNIRSILLLGITGVLLTSGCASYRVLTNLKPEADANLQSPAGRFYIAGLKYAVNIDDAPGTKKSAGDIDAVYERRLLPIVRKECLARYPSLFVKDRTESIPLWVEVGETLTSHHGNAWFLCTLGLSGMIFPVPDGTDREMDVSISLWNGGNTRGSEVLRKNFRREEHIWLSLFTPLALITIPGESDFPKGSSAFDGSRFGYDSVPQVAQQVATATAKLIAAKDPEFWTTQPRLNNSSIGLPTRTGEAPVAPPVPSDSPTPF